VSGLLQLTSDGGGVASASVIMRHTTGADFATHQFGLSGLGASSASNTGWTTSIIPYTGNLYYIISVVGGSGQSFTVNVMGYQIPNGGE
jgi:hypothetical protein